MIGYTEIKQKVIYKLLFALSITIFPMLLSILTKDVLLSYVGSFIIFIMFIIVRLFISNRYEFHIFSRFWNPKYNRISKQYHLTIKDDKNRISEFQKISIDEVKEKILYYDNKLNHLSELLNDQVKIISDLKQSISTDENKLIALSKEVGFQLEKINDSNLEFSKIYDYQMKEFVKLIIVKFEDINKSNLDISTIDDIPEFKKNIIRRKNIETLDIIISTFEIYRDILLSVSEAKKKTFSKEYEELLFHFINKISQQMSEQLTFNRDKK